MRVSSVLNPVAKTKRLEKYERQIQSYRSDKQLEFIPDEDKLYQVQMKFVELFLQFVERELDKAV